VRPVTVGASLVDVADEQVGAALVAELPDLPQRLLDRDPGFFGAPLAQVVAVGIDEPRSQSPTTSAVRPCRTSTRRPVPASMSTVA
jgi:hypothetical protein